MDKRCQGKEAELRRNGEKYISASKEFVKKVVHQRVMELESIAKDIKAYEYTMSMDGSDQISPISSGLEVFQRLAVMSSEELTSKLSSLTAMDELTDKTARQVVFESIVSAIISDRSLKVASSSI